MYGLSSMKPRLPVDGAHVSCPVRGCRVTVPFQRAVVRATPEFQCPVHRLYLSASTFRYERETDNLLWADRHSLAVLNRSRSGTEERSFGAELSEEALAWNTFGWLERAGLLAEALERWISRPVPTAETWYWGRDRNGTVPFALRRARSTFGEDETASGDLTTPAFMAETPDVLVLVDPRLVAFRPVQAGKGGVAGYADGGDAWAEKVLEPGWEELFGDRVMRELLRLWLVGGYAAHLLEKELVLLHLVPGWAGSGVSPRLDPRLRQEGGRSFLAGHWEEAYRLAVERPGVPDAAAFVTYFEEKSAGYDPSGRLLRAFSVSPAPADAVSRTRVS